MSGMEFNPSKVSELLSMMQADGDPQGFGDVLMGHQYARGDGRKQNYEEAAKYFSIAASKGNAEGMYNLVEATCFNLTLQGSINFQWARCRTEFGYGKTVVGKGCIQAIDRLSQHEDSRGC
jgi:TPR repeat protein